MCHILTGFWEWCCYAQRYFNAMQLFVYCAVACYIFSGKAWSQKVGGKDTKVYFTGAGKNCTTYNFAEITWSIFRMKRQEHF